MKQGNSKTANDLQKFKLNIQAREKFDSLNSEYKNLVENIKKELGSLEDIRTKLSLSRRQISKLLMVDPSAWTRWTRPDQDAPPHIYQALQWYSQLVEKMPDIHAPLNLENKFELLRKDADLKLQKLKTQIDSIQAIKMVQSDPFSKFSNLLSDNFKNLTDRLIEFQNMKGVGELEILKYTNQQLQEKTQSLEDQVQSMLNNFKESVNLKSTQIQKRAKKLKADIKKRTTKAKGKIKPKVKTKTSVKKKPNAKVASPRTKFSKIKTLNKNKKKSQKPNRKIKR